MESTNYNINQTQGLPYIFVANLMTEIRDIMKMYSNNFASQVEKLLHRNLNNFEDKQTKQNSNNWKPILISALINTKNSIE